MLYFEISRARDGAELVIDDKAGLKKQVEARSGERIATHEALGEDWAKSRSRATMAPFLDTSRAEPHVHVLMAA